MFSKLLLILLLGGCLPAALPTAQAGDIPAATDESAFSYASAMNVDQKAKSKFMTIAYYVCMCSVFFGLIILIMGLFELTLGGHQEMGNVKVKIIAGGGMLLVPTIFFGVLKAIG
jgi:hypothetical protein